MRTRLIAVIAAGAAIALLLAGVARAAATPTATTEHARHVTDTTAVLRGTINPHGVDTDYTFNYGVTPSYGATTPARSAGSGRKTITVAVRIGGLEPGTTYHFQIAAVSAAGSASGADLTFKTKGNPPSTVTTGGAVAVGTERAGVTGTIDPNGAPTTWYVQYGLSTAYGVQTFPQTLAAGSVPDPVGATLTGLAPAHLFHYRIVAFHGSIASYGADATFFTRPLHPPRPGLHARTSPSRDSRSPYTFTTRGSLRGGRHIPAAYRCTGTVNVGFYNGRHRLATAVADVGADCRFTTHASFRHTHGHGRVRLRVLVRYAGNGYLRGSSTVDHVTVGR
jgi:hypothetical protein